MEDAKRSAETRLGDDLDSARVVRSGKERYGGLYGFFQQERFVIELEVQGNGEVSKPAEASTPAEDATAAPTLESLLTETTDTVRVAGGEQDFARELELVLADAASGVSPASAVTERPRREMAKHTRSDTEPTTTLATRPTSTAPNRYLETAPQRPIEWRQTSLPQTLDEEAGIDEGDTYGALVDGLIGAGLRETYVPLPDGTDFGLLLARRLAELPTARRPMTASGEVVVIVGPVREAEHLALGIAALSSSSGSVSVASHRRLPASVGYPRAHTPQEAGALVFEQRLADSLSVVIVDIECRAEFIAHTVAGLHPGTIWAVVPAAWTSREVDELATGCGRIDALALYGLLTADRPAGLIGESWPIAFVDGWQASPLSLASRLLEAIAVSR
jgi:hypothetical protein